MAESLAIRARSGVYFDLSTPSAEGVRLGDIAHALSQLPRFGGHGLTHHSMAAHCLEVAEDLQTHTGDILLALHGLLHEAPHAYLGIVAPPVERLLPGWADLERRVLATIYTALGLPLPSPSQQALVAESNMRSVEGEYRALMAMREQLSDARPLTPIKFDTHTEAARRYAQKYAEYRAALG